MFLLSIFQEKFNDRIGKRIVEIVEIPQDARKWIGKASSKRTLHFTFVRNHFESIGKPILLKGGKVLLVNNMLIRAQEIVAKKHPQALPPKSVLSQTLKIGATNFPIPVPPIPNPRQTQPNPSHFGATDSIPVPPSLGCQLSVTQIHVFGPTENVGSASPRLEI